MAKKDSSIRVSPALTREQVEFLDKLSNDACFSGGAKLSSSAIMRAMIAALKKINPDVSGVKDENELVERFLKTRKK